MRVDWTDSQLPYDDGDIVKAQVFRCSEGKSKSGDAMFVVDFCDAKDSKYLCRDRIVCEGVGRHIGQQKLIALGFEKGTENIDPTDLVGREVYLFLDKSEWNGEFCLGVGLTWEDEWRAGYWSVDKKPPHGVKNEVDEVPF